MNKIINPDASVFITGGTGFLGSHLRERLQTVGCDVTILSRSGRVRDLKGNESVIQGDISEGNDFLRETYDVIFHLAALTSIERSVESPMVTWNVNANGTVKLLEAARETSPKLLVYASTASVYGPPKYLPIDEDHPLNPLEPYGASKLAADRLMHAYHHAYDLPTVTLRLFNMFGPGQPPHNVVSAVLSQAFDGDVVELGNLSPSRDFIYVRDAVDAILTIVSEGERGGTYNVGRGTAVEIGKLAAKIVEMIERDVKLVSAQDRQRAEGIEIPKHVADVSKLQSLGWTPEYNLTTGLKETIAAYRKQQESDSES